MCSASPSSNSVVYNKQMERERGGGCNLLTRSSPFCLPRRHVSVLVGTQQNSKSKCPQFPRWRSFGNIIQQQCPEVFLFLSARRWEMEAQPWRARWFRAAEPDARTIRARKCKLRSDAKKKNPRIPGRPVEGAARGLLVQPTEASRRGVAVHDDAPLSGTQQAIRQMAIGRFIQRWHMNVSQSQVSGTEKQQPRRLRAHPVD